MNVEVQSKTIVKPSAPTLNQRRKLGLSFIDDLLFPRYVGIIFYCQAHGRTHESSTFERLRLLEESLSKTLALFYPLVGQYVEDGLFMDCNDLGVEFIQAKVDGTPEKLLEGVVDPDLLNCLSKFLLQAVNNPLAVVKVNEFDCGGLAIGPRFSHKRGDMYTMATFMNSWATACQSGIDEGIPPNFELPSLFPVKEPAFRQRPTLPRGRSSHWLDLNSAA